MKMRITVDAQTFEVEVGDLKTRPVLVLVDGETFQVWPQENGKISAEAVQAASAPAVTMPPVIPAAAVSAAEKVRAVLAPIPGVILSISVKEGDTVAFGQELCVLEAMKMKNMIRANRGGTIACIRVAAGDQVKHSQVLMEYSD